MAVRLKRLSEDCVDSFTHTWSLAAFLVLALILLLAPDNQYHKPMLKLKENEGNYVLFRPRYKANCWCPAQFVDSQVKYANEVCSRIYSKMAATGKNPTDKFDNVVPQSASEFLKDELLPVVDESKDEKSNDRSKRTMADRQRYEPLLLFILAIAFRLPQLFCSILSRCCGCINVERTLESAEKGDSLPHEDRRQVYAGLVRSFRDSTRGGGNSTAYLYCLMKILMIIILVVQTIFVAHRVVPEVLETSSSPENRKMSQPETTRNAPSPTPTAIPVTNTTDSDDAQSKNDDYDKSLHPPARTDPLEPIFRCSYTIRQIANAYDFAVQCVVTDTLQPQQETRSQYPTLNTNVFLIALANLVILLSVHFLNTLLWFGSLCSDSTRIRFGLVKDSPLDLVFMIQMARDNMSVGVAAGLAEAARPVVGVSQ